MRLNYASNRVIGASSDVHNAPVQHLRAALASFSRRGSDGVQVLAHWLVRLINLDYLITGH
jgi:hypothetical protein